MKVNDHRKIHKKIYKVKQNVIELIEVPELQFIVARGKGHKNVYQMHEGDALWSIRRLTNRLKEMTKNEIDYRFKLMPLEIIWYRDEQVQNDETWSWTAMMQVPDLINEDMFETALVELEKRKRSVRVPLKLEKLHQGLCVQTLHVGPYHQIKDSKEKIKDYCEVNGYKINGHFREIYLNQPFCNAPEKLETIVRVEVKELSN